jgi:RNA polymerase sigma factor (sigma-70 family)
MEASTIQSTAALCPTRVTIGPRLLRLRSDEQLVALFRAGHDEAFQVIYDRYHKRLEAYARRMLSGAHDAEDVLQEVFVRAYRALLTGDRELAVKAWLFRIVHNRCIDELRRMAPPVVELVDSAESHNQDPASQVDARDSLRRLLEDIRRLPEQQRSALLLRELSGISYSEVASVLETSVPAVKSLLVRARMGLVRASEARDTACAEIREQLAEAQEHGVRANSTVRNHLRDCQGCRSYRREIFLVRKRVAALAPVGPFAALAKLIGLPGGGATGTGGAGSAAALGGGAASGAAIGAGHVATLLAAAIASAGGAVGLQHVIGLGQSPAPIASASQRAHPRAHSTADLSSATGSSSYAPAAAGARAAGGRADPSGGLGGSGYGQGSSGASPASRGDSLISTSDTGGGQGQTPGTAGGTTGTQTWSTGSGSTVGSTGSDSGSGAGSGTTGSTGTPTAGPGSTEGAGVGVTPPPATAGGTSGTGSTTSTGTTTTVGGTTVSTTGTGTTGSGSGTAGDVTGTGQGTTTTPTTGTSGSSSGQTSSGSTTTTGTTS